LYSGGRERRPCTQGAGKGGLVLRGQGKEALYSGGRERRPCTQGVGKGGLVLRT
jgi:hypothetical protein